MHKDETAVPEDVKALAQHWLTQGNLVGHMSGEATDPLWVISQAIMADRATRPASGGEAVAREWQKLVEKDDRTSPENHPDMVLITQDELAQAMSASPQEADSVRAEALAIVENAAVNPPSGWPHDENIDKEHGWTQAALFIKAKLLAALPAPPKNPEPGETE